MSLLCTLKPKQCATCNETFTPNSHRQTYCSLVCKFGESDCQTCGVRFVRKQKTTGLYCSPACWYAAYDAKNKKTCPICGKEFEGHSSQKTCSYKCADKSRRTAKRNTRCAQCGKPLKPNCHPRTKFCSHRCGLLDRDRRGQLHAAEGTRTLHSNGYVLLKVGKKWVLEHRHVMQQKLGRSLEEHERVHHKDGNRSNNNPSNLELWKVKKKDPAGVRADDYHCPGCRCFESH